VNNNEPIYMGLGNNSARLVLGWCAHSLDLLVEGGLGFVDELLLGGTSESSPLSSSKGWNITPLTSTSSFFPFAAALHATVDPFANGTLAEADAGTDAESWLAAAAATAGDGAILRSISE
jgi:hypothetical protein